MALRRKILPSGIPKKSYAVIRLERVAFYGFQSPNRRAEVYFSRDAASVIYGDNGCGKTTFLKLIHAVLNKDSNILKKEGVKRAEIDYRVDDGGIQSVSVQPFPDGYQVAMESVDASSLNLDGMYDWREIEGSELSYSSSLSMGVERGTTTLPARLEVEDILRYIGAAGFRDIPRSRAVEFSEGLVVHLRNFQAVRSRGNREGFDPEDAHPYLHNIKISNIESLLLERYRVAKNIATGKIQNALFDTLAVAIEQSELGAPELKKMPNDFGGLILRSKERIIEALKDGSENKFKNRVISFLNGFTSPDEVVKLMENQILCQLIINMTTELQIERQLLSAINIFVDTFNSFLVEGKELVVTKDELYIVIDGDEHHSIDVLSSGERHIFTFLALIVVAGRSRDFIFIDEPEISLNMLWQRTLLELLKKIAPDTQIIVASHSPAIAQENPWCLVELKPEKVN
jgi:ABC-type lipoprotein export system ATPase subunit